MQEKTQITDFLSGTRNITVPFTFIHDECAYNCTDVLRLLPSKRLVLDAITTDQHLVIKLFPPSKKGQRQLIREQQGYRLATAAGLNVPALLLTSDNMIGCVAIGYQFIENSQPFDLQGEAGATRLLNLMANMHQYGIMQDDIHIDNILMAGDELYVIDLGSIVCEQAGKPLSQAASISNLALLIAQFVPQIQTQLMQLIAVYYQARAWTFDNQHQAQLLLALDLAWQKRKRKYSSKCFRNCTMTKYSHSASCEFAFRSDFLAGLSFDLINNIDSLMATGKALKVGSSATVVQVEIDGRKLVIKRYNIKGFWHFLRRCLQPSRAAISWRNANLLECIGLATPKPLGFIENRIGWLRYTAYFISEYEAAQGLQQVYSNRTPTQQELNQIKYFFSLMATEKISHGDLKASNLLLNEHGKLSIIDLDAMREHTSHKTFLPAFAKDKKRFLKNWDDSKLKAIFQRQVF